MQIRRLALAAVIIAALAALGWFALRSTQRAQVGLDAAPHADTPGVSPAAPELERTEAAPTRSSAAPVPAPAAPAEPAEPKDWSASTPGKPSPSAASGLFVRVLDPESKPLPGAEVSFVSSGPFVRNVGGPLTTGASGYVRLRNGPEGSLDIRASDPEGRYGPAYAFDRHDTEGTFDLRLDATAPHTLLVLDGRGAPVEHFAWRVLDELQYRSHKSGKPFLDEHGLLCDTRLDDGPMGTFTPSEDDRSEHAEGRVELRTGSLAFVVQVDAEEYAPAQAGPFTPATAPGEIRVVLQHLPGDPRPRRVRRQGRRRRVGQAARPARGRARATTQRLPEPRRAVRPRGSGVRGRRQLRAAVAHVGRVHDPGRRGGSLRGRAGSAALFRAPGCRRHRTRAA